MGFRTLNPLGRAAAPLLPSCCTDSAARPTGALTRRADVGIRCVVRVPLRAVSLLSVPVCSVADGIKEVFRAGAVLKVLKSIVGIDSVEVPNLQSLGLLTDERRCNQLMDVTRGTYVTAPEVDVEVALSVGARLEDAFSEVLAPSVAPLHYPHFGSNAAETRYGVLALVPNDRQPLLGVLDDRHITNDNGLVRQAAAVDV